MAKADQYIPGNFTRDQKAWIVRETKRRRVSRGLVLRDLVQDRIDSEKQQAAAA